jgi:uncharacterized protein YdhG (YjbR/CyaY superfamily)
MHGKPSSIDDYLARVEPGQRKVLQQLRKSILSIVPGAVECISYSMPAFRVNGKVVAGFLATSQGSSFYPFSGSTLATLADELVDYDKTKSALHFSAERPLPIQLLRQLLSTRIAENAPPSEPKSAANRRPAQQASNANSNSAANRRPAQQASKANSKSAANRRPAPQASKANSKSAANRRPAQQVSTGSPKRNPLSGSARAKQTTKARAARTSPARS